VTEAVSIVIPTRNRAPVLKLCLDALAQQRTNGYSCNVIVVDDCSTDSTERVVAECALASPFPIELIRQRQPLGANSARNLGIDKALGEVVVFLDDDVLVPEGWFGVLVSGLRTGKHPVMSGGVKLTSANLGIGKHRAEISGYLGEILTAPVGPDGFNVPVLGNMAVYRWVFDRARFDPAIRPPMEEADWLSRAGVTAGFIPEAWAWHHKTGNQLRVGQVLRGSWQRGGEGGRWLREEQRMPLGERLRLTFRSLGTATRAAAHAVVHRCWGGAVIATGEFSKAASLVGLTNRGQRTARSWR
jgi:glycosyltransferase involved in cell wall biosynthesis